MERCCEEPAFAGPAPLENDEEMTTIGICGNCGYNHGSMSVEKAEKLFEHFKAEKKAEQDETKK